MGELTPASTFATRCTPLASIFYNGEAKGGTMTALLPGVAVVLAASSVHAGYSERHGLSRARSCGEWVAWMTVPAHASWPNADKRPLIPIRQLVDCVLRSRTKAHSQRVQARHFPLQPGIVLGRSFDASCAGTRPSWMVRLRCPCVVAGQDGSILVKRQISEPHAGHGSSMAHGALLKIWPLDRTERKAWPS